MATYYLIVGENFIFTLVLSFFVWKPIVFMRWWPGIYWAHKPATPAKLLCSFLTVEFDPETFGLIQHLHVVPHFPLGDFFYASIYVARQIGRSIVAIKQWIPTSLSSGWKCSLKLVTVSIARKSAPKTSHSNAAKTRHKDPSAEKWNILCPRFMHFVIVICTK